MPKNVLLVIGHGREDSLCHKLLRTARKALEIRGCSTRVQDLLADGFDPVLRLPPGARHARPEHVGPLARRYQDDVRWMDALVVVHPVWWFAPPANLKGWVDQVLVDGVAIEQPPEGPPRPKLSGRRALLIQTFNAPRAADRIYMRNLAGQFWRRAVFASTGIVQVERVALYGVEAMAENDVARAEHRIDRAIERITR